MARGQSETGGSCSKHTSDIQMLKQTTAFCFDKNKPWGNQARGINSKYLVEDCNK